MRLANKIQRDLMASVQKSGYEVLIPNYYYGRYEMDLFRLMPNGYVVEYEIKISRADFKNDFKKAHSQLDGDFKELWKKGVKYSDMPRITTSKHDLIAARKGNCNRFWFVVPEGLIKPEEVPKHCGLMYYIHNPRLGWFKQVKNAPLIKGHIVTEESYKRISVSLAFREQAHRQKAWIAARANDKRYLEIKNLTKILKNVPKETFTKPIGLDLYCPNCYTKHVDDEVMAKRPHTSHICEECEDMWEPYPFPTYGI